MIVAEINLRYDSLVLVVAYQGDIEGTFEDFDVYPGNQVHGVNPR